MMKTFRILFTGVGRRVELIQAFRQAANRLNVNLKLYGADMAGTAPALAFCDYTRKVCGMRDADYIPQLLRICEADHIDLLIPTIDTESVKNNLYLVSDSMVENCMNIHGCICSILHTVCRCAS